MTDYVEVIKTQINRNSMVRGYQGRLAQAAQCQTSYLSRVLRDQAQLSPEQAIRLAEFWGFTEDETEYFLELVNLGRTNFPPLVRRIKARLAKLQAAHTNLSSRINESKIIEDERSGLYYSSWHYMAIHILVGISSFQTVEAIATRLNVPASIVRDSLTYLSDLGLVTTNGRKWLIKPTHLHLPSTSAFTSINHSNWRQRATLDSQIRSSDGLHYTVIQSHSEKDFQKIRTIWLEAIEKARQVMKPSANEELTCICLDYFRVK